MQAMCEHGTLGGRWCDRCDGVVPTREECQLADALAARGWQRPNYYGPWLLAVTGYGEHLEQLSIHPNGPICEWAVIVKGQEADIRLEWVQTAAQLHRPEWRLVVPLLLAAIQSRADASAQAQAERVAELQDLPL